jgi:hypothetical protein
MRNISRIKQLMLLSVILFAQTGFGLVRPELADIEAQPWMASIYVVNDEYDVSEVVCQGSLIDANWVLSTRDCVYDYLELLPEQVWSWPDTYYAVSLGGAEEKIAVTTSTRSDDGALMMFQLGESSTNQTIALSSRSFESLIGESVSIFGNSESQSIRDPYYNAGGGDFVSCSVDGELFVAPNDVCYVVAFPEESENLLVSRATIVDPESDTAPQEDVDTFYPFVLDGSRLYLDFRESPSHPCIEDVGAPVVTVTDDSEFELVGVVVSTGPRTGSLVCNPSLANIFASVEAFMDFIDGTIAQPQLAADCPGTPTMSLEETGGSGVRVSWDEIAGAQGYNLILSYALGYSPLVELDLGNITEVATDVDPETKYSLKLLAYNAQCTSELSNTITIHLAAE